jgi:hypothetical protein
MKEIIPAIMPTSYEDLLEKAKFVRGIVPLSQIDVMDGKFVKSKSWPYRQAGVANEEHFLAMQTQDEMLPAFRLYELAVHDIDLGKRHDTAHELRLLQKVLVRRRHDSRDDFFHRFIGRAKFVRSS